MSMPEIPERTTDPQVSLIHRPNPSSYAPVEYVDVPTAEPEDTTGDSGLGEYFQMVNRHRLAVAFSAVFCAMMGLLIAKLPRIPMYSATTTVQFQSNELPTISARNNPFSAPTNVGLYAQVSMLRSGNIIER